MDNSTDRQRSEFANPNLEIFILAEAIQQRILELGSEVARDYAGLNPLIIGPKTDACFFLSDLVRATDITLDVQFMEVEDEEYSGEIRILADLNVAIEGRHVVIVDVMVDTGLRQSYLLPSLRSRGAAGVRPVALLDNFSRRKREVEIDYLGFKIPG